MIRLGIISDIHSHEKSDKSQGGYYFPSMSDSPICQNPFAAIKQLFRDEKITVNYLLSPGDYAHRMDVKGLKSSWEQLKILKNELNAKMLIGTIGNHDVSSRSSGDSFKEIKIFDIDFPVYRDTGSKKYLNSLLENSFFVIDDSELDILFIVLNSCYDHWDEFEASHGKVRKDDLREVKRSISLSNRSIKILLVHHHPIVHETGISDTGDLIEGSEELLNNIDGVDLIIHGHKHDFRFTQSKIYPKNLNILASGSFACFKTSMKTGEQNSFHIVEFHEEELSDCKNQGIILTYLYDPASGWSLDPNIQEGFGCLLENNQLCDIMKEGFESQAEPYIQWNEFLVSNPVLKYITREQRLKALERLKNLGFIKRFSLDRFNNLIGDIIIR